MNRTLLLPAAALLAAAALVGPSAEAGGRKLVRFEAGTLQSVVTGAFGGSKSTNYVLDYRITNATDAAAKPRIRLEVRTDTSKTHLDAADSAAFAAAAKALGRKEAPASTATLRGNDLDAGATADGMACFGTIDPHARAFEVRVYGLFDRVFRDRQGRVWAENRVLVMSYARPGDEFDRFLDPVTLQSVREEVEGDPVQLNARP